MTVADERELSVGARARGGDRLDPLERLTRAAPPASGSSRQLLNTGGKRVRGIVCRDDQPR